MPLSAALLGNVDILTPNQTEAGTLLSDTGLRIQNFGHAEEAAARLLAAGARAVLLKLGDLGCCYASAEESIRAEAVPVTAVDTTAAGDVFNGALAVALAEDQSMREAMHFANAAAAISVTRRGAQSSTPTRAEVEPLLVKRAR
jgi:ribokinase